MDGLSRAVAAADSVFADPNLADSVSADLVFADLQPVAPVGEPCVVELLALCFEPAPARSDDRFALAVPPDDYSEPAEFGPGDSCRADFAVVDFAGADFGLADLGQGNSAENDWARSAAAASAQGGSPVDCPADDQSWLADSRAHWSGHLQVDWARAGCSRADYSPVARWQVDCSPADCLVDSPGDLRSADCRDGSLPHPDVDSQPADSLLVRLLPDCSADFQAHSPGVPQAWLRRLQDGPRVLVLSADAPLEHWRDAPFPFASSAAWQWVVRGAQPALAAAPRKQRELVVVSTWQRSDDGRLRRAAL